MLQVMSKYWWAFVTRGLLAVLFGLLAFVMTGRESYILARVFCVYALLEGLLAIIPSLSSAAAKIWWTLMFEGITSVVLGVFSFIGPGGIGSALWPDVSATTALIIIALWAIVTGILEVLAAIRLPREMGRKWALLLGGALSILFGITALILRPIEGVTAACWLIGIYAVTFGALLIFPGLGFRKNGWKERPVEAL